LTYTPAAAAMSGTLISSLLWVPRGHAAQMPKKYELNEDELQRVGKMGGEGVLEKLRLEMEALNAKGDQSDDEEDWEECVD
jgi:periodic tryptophan protein 1